MSTPVSFGLRQRYQDIMRLRRIAEIHIFLCKEKR